MATGAIVGGIFALGGLGLQIGGAIAQGEQDKRDAEAAAFVAEEQYNLSTKTLAENYYRELNQSRVNSAAAIKNQNTNYTALLGNARENAAIKTESVNRQEGFQSQSASAAGTGVISQTDARRGVSGASGKSSELVRKNQRGQLASQQENIGDQADFAREGIQTSLTQTSGTLKRNLDQNLESIATQQSQFEEDTGDSLRQSLDQAAINQFSTEYGIPNAGDINAATTLDSLAAGLDFGSELVDLFDLPSNTDTRRYY